MRRAGDEVVVAQLDVGWGAPHDTAELCVLRIHDDPGRKQSQWDIKRLPIVVHRDDGRHTTGDGGVNAVIGPWQTDAVVPAGDCFLCWVDYFGGILVCDVANPTRLVFVPLPVETDPDLEDRRHSSDRRPNMQITLTVAGAGTDNALRFVSSDRRCCCGGPGASKCARSRYMFAITTWTMSLLPGPNEDPRTLSWVKTGMFDCDEIWASPSYAGLPRVPLECPVVSTDDPDVVCLMLDNAYRFHIKMDNKDKRQWTVMVNTKTKKVVSVLAHHDFKWSREFDVPMRLRIH